MTNPIDSSDDAIAALCDKLITFDRCLQLLRAVADTPAPSGASSLTRGKPVMDWFADSGMKHHGASLTLDHQRTGCAVISLGAGGLRLLAHLDEVSYLVEGPPLSPGVWPVAPYCYHLAEQPAPARVIRFDAMGGWSVLGYGQVLSKDGGHFFRCSPDVHLRPGDRVCLASDVNCDTATGLVTGSLDNAAGVVSGLLAASVLAEVGVPFSLVLTDEEEGPSGASSQTIARGASRYLRQAPDAPLTVAIDIHGVPDQDLRRIEGHAIPWGASLAEFSSHGRGSVAPPQLYVAVRKYLLEESSISGTVTPNFGGYVPRSDDVSAMTHSNRVLIMGFPGMNRHFDRGLPTANIHDLLDLARALVALAVGVTTQRLAVDW